MPDWLTPEEWQALSLSLKAGWPSWLCFLLAGLAAFGGMSAVQFLLTHWRAAT